jgi:hypothetical protein
MLRSRVARLSLVSLLIAVVSASPMMAACPNPTFTELTPVPSEHDVNEFAIGDVDGDTQVDLVTVSSAAQTIKVQLGNGDGTFSLPLTYTAPSPTEVTLGDLNNDSFPDIIVASEPAQTEECLSFGSCAGVSVLLNDGDGTFGNATTTPVPYALSILAVDTADFDDDGKPDVLVGAPPIIEGDVALHVFFGDGAGALPTRHSWSVDGPLLDALAVNLAGPGAQPAVVAAIGPGVSATSTRVNVYASQDGTFPAISATRNITTVSSPEAHLTVADFNRNGTLDLALSYRHSDAPVMWGAAVLIATGNTSLVFGGSFAETSGTITDIAAADVDEDGDVDVMLAYGANLWKIYRRTAANQFDNEPVQPQGSFSPAASARRVLLDDFDRDGRPDFLFLDTLNDAVIPLRNVCSSRTSVVTLTSSPNPSTFGSEVTFTITVEPKPGAPTPTGTVTLNEGTTVLDTAPLDGSGTAVITLSMLSVGTHAIHAVYGGDSNFASQKSATINHTVDQPPFGPPLFVTATGNAAANAITVRWTPTADSASFDVLRRVNGAWVAIAPNVTGTSYVDMNVSNSSAYVYAVWAHSTGGETSAPSNSDIATTMPLFLSSDHKIRASDIISTRLLVNSLRSAAGLQQFAFTDASLVGVKIKAIHITELRTKLNNTRTMLGFPALTFTNPTLTENVSPVRLVDIQEIRNSFQ